MSLTFPRCQFEIISYQPCSLLNKAYFWPSATILGISGQDSLTFLKQWFMNLVHYQFKGEVMNESDLIEALSKDTGLTVGKAEELVRLSDAGCLMKNHSSTRAIFLYVKYQVSSIQYYKNPGPDRLAMLEFYSFRFRNITATTACYNHVAPPDPVSVSGRGGRA